MSTEVIGCAATYRDTIVLSDTSTGFADHTERVTLVEHQPELVLSTQLDLESVLFLHGEMKTHDSRKVQHHPIVLKDPLCDDEFPCQFSALSLPFSLDRLQNSFEVFHVTVRIPFNLRSRDL